MTDILDPLTLKGVTEWLGGLTGFRLSSVNFVLDYLILGFDERGGMTALVWPEVFKKEEKFVYGMDRYRNELCSLIGCPVKTSSITLDETIIINFGDRNSLHIPLRSYELPGERLILTAPKHLLLVL